MSSKPVTIKKEPQDFSIKTEPSFDNASGSNQDVKMEADDEDDDVFEDSLDLDTSKVGNKVWLVRLPKFLMEKWHNPDNLHGQELGHVRIYSDTNSNLPPDQQKVKVKLILNESPENSDIPHEYDVSLQKHIDGSTYVFTEKDMPKYDKKRAQQVAAKREQQRLQQQQQRKGKFQFNKDRFVPYVKTIPSMQKIALKPSCFLHF